MGPCTVAGVSTGRPDLYAAKLRALVKARWGEAEREPGTFPGGAVLHDAAADRGWVLAEEHPARALGGALAWARRWGVAELHVLAAGSTGTLARRASAFSVAPAVWRIEGTSLVEAAADPPGQPAGIPAAAQPFVEVITAAGADPAVEDGILIGEVLGLEVCRVIVDDHGAYLEVGVGKHDRETQHLIHGDVPKPAALAAAVAAVKEVRRPGALPHQLNQIARSRWLRAVLLGAPELAGAAWLRPASMGDRPDDLRVSTPAAASGEDPEGRPRLVVTTTGIDVDLVPAAADARLSDPRDPTLVLVVPEADDHPLTRDLASALRAPAEIVTVPNDWQHLLH